MLKTAHRSREFAGVLARHAIQLSIDPAWVLDRQGISGEVTAGCGARAWTEIGIGLAQAGPKLRAGTSSFTQATAPE